MSVTLLKKKSTGNASSRNSLYKQNGHNTPKTKNSEPIKKSVDIPLWAYCNEEYFEVAHINDFDKLNPFDKNTLLATSSLEIRDLLKVTEEYKEEPLISLPKWHLDLKKDEMNLTFTYPKDLLEDVATKQQNNFTQGTAPQFSISYDLHQSSQVRFKEVGSLDGQSDRLNITTIEKGKLKIENLPVSIETKRLILEKYYRGKNHSDLKKVKAVDKAFSSLLYELFSKVYKERPTIEVEEASGGGDFGQKYVACHIFNKETLSTGVGPSKKLAKCEASLKSLEIFAPSLVESLEKQIEKLTTDNMEEENVKKSDFLSSNQHLESSQSTEISSQEKSGLGFGNLSQETKEDTSSPQCTAEDLAIEFPQTLANIVKDPAIMTRILTIYDIYTNLLNFILKEKQDMETRLSNGESLELDDPVDYYCTNKVFTKLHALHHLLNKKGRQFPMVNCVQVGQMYNAFLHCPDLGQNFMYQSESYEFSVEMVKHELIFASYPTCEDLVEVLKAMKDKFDQEKERIINRDQEYHERKSQFDNSLCQKRPSQWVPPQKPRYNNYSGEKRNNNYRRKDDKQRGYQRYPYNNKFPKYNRIHNNIGNNEQLDLLQKKIKVSS